MTKTLMLRDLPRNYSNFRWGVEQVQGFLRWLVARLPQKPLPPIIIQGGDGFTPARQYMNNTRDEEFDPLVDRLMEDLMRARL